MEQIYVLLGALVIVTVIGIVGLIGSKKYSKSAH